MSRILVVEDNLLNYELACDLLELAGHRVLHASTGEAAITMALQEQPDIILMDIGLPGMDGFEATRHLKSMSETQSIPVVAVTAHAMKEDAERVFSAGCSGYLTKPIDTRRFVAEVEAILAAASPASRAEAQGNTHE